MLLGFATKLAILILLRFLVSATSFRSQATARRSLPALWAESGGPGAARHQVLRPADGRRRGSHYPERPAGGGRRRRRLARFENDAQTLPARLLRELDKKSLLELEKWVECQASEESTATLARGEGASTRGRGKSPLAMIDLSSRQESDLVRYLSRRGAEAQATVSFVRHCSRHRNGHLYTAAIRALGNSTRTIHRHHHHKAKGRTASMENYRMCLELFSEMKKFGIRPSLYTFSSLFQAAPGASAAKELHMRLQTDFPALWPWTTPVWTSAIAACSRNVQKQRDHDASATALLFWEAIVDNGLEPTDRSYAEMLYVCAATGNLTLAERFKRELLQKRVLTTAKNGGDSYALAPYAWNALLSTFATLGQADTVLHVLKCMAASSTRDISDRRHLRRGQHHHQHEQQIHARHYSAYLKALIQSDNSTKRAIQVLEHMAGIHEDQSLPPPPSDGVDLLAALTVLRASSHDDAHRLLQRLARGEFGTSLHPNHACYHSVLSSCSDPQVALDLIEQMRLTRRHRIGVAAPTQVSYTHAIAVCRRHVQTRLSAGYKDPVRTARFMLKQAREVDGLEPDTYMYSAAIWTAAEAAQPSVALELLREMQEDLHYRRKERVQLPFTPNVVSYNGCIAAFAKAASIADVPSDGNKAGSLKELAVDAIAVFEEMLSQGIRPTLVTFRWIAAAILPVPPRERIALLQQVSALANRTGGYHDSQTIGSDDAVQQDALVPIFESLIQTHGCLGNFEEAERLFTSYSGFQTETACTRAMAFACSTCIPAAWKYALSVFEKHLAHTRRKEATEGRDDAVDPTLMGHVMVACSKAGMWEESLALLLRHGSGQVPTLAVNSLIGACGRAAKPEIALQILNDHMDSLGIAPDALTFRNAIIACNQAEHRDRSSNPGVQRKQDPNRSPPLIAWWECALSLLRRMAEVGLEPDKQCYSSVISACEAAGEWQRALGVLQNAMDKRSAKRNGHVLNLYCFNAAISACEKGGAWVEALEVYEQMKEYGGGELRPNVVTVSSVVLALDKAGQKELAQSIYLEGIRKGFVSSPWRITRDAASGARVEAIDLHSFSAAMSRAAVRSYLDSLLGSRTHMTHKSRPRPPIRDFILIVGKGLRSEAQDPVLFPAVRRLLKREFGLHPTPDPWNGGRLVVAKDDMRAFVATHRWT